MVIIRNVRLTCSGRRTVLYIYTYDAAVTTYPKFAFCRYNFLIITYIMLIIFFVLLCVLMYAWVFFIFFGWPIYGYYLLLNPYLFNFGR